MSSSFTVRVVGFQANTDDRDALLKLQQSLKIAIVQVNVGQSDTEVTLGSAKDAESFRRQLPLFVKDGSRRLKIRLNQEIQQEPPKPIPGRWSLRKRPIFIEVDKIYTWQQEFKNAPRAGNRGVLVPIIPEGADLWETIEYFEDAALSNGGDIHHIFTIRDGVFISFHDESVAESVIEQHHVLNGRSVTVLPKIVPEYMENKFILKTSRDLKQKFIEMDLESCHIGMKKLEKIEDRVFLISNEGTPGDPGLDQLMQKLKDVKGLEKIVRLRKTDCLSISAKKPIKDYVLDALFKRIGMKAQITKKEKISPEHFLVFFSNPADSERILEKFTSNPIKLDDQDIQITRYLPHFCHEHEVSSAMINLCKRWEAARLAQTIKSSTRDSTRSVVPLAHSQDSAIVKIVGLESGVNSVKLRIYLEKKLGVPIKVVELQNTRAALTFENSEVARSFREKFPREIVYKLGAKEHRLKLETTAVYKLASKKHGLKLQTTAPENTVESSSSVVSDMGRSGHIEQRTQSYFDAIFTWSNHPPDLIECNKRGILVADMTVATEPQMILEYFRDSSLSGGGPVLDMISLVDGIFITFQDSKVVGNVLKQDKHEIDGKPLSVFRKIIPEFCSDRLLMKKTSHDANEKVLKLTLQNCSPDQIAPTSIEKRGFDSALVMYSNEMNLDRLMDIVEQAKRDTDTKEMQVTLLPKPDCLKVQMLKGNNLKTAKPVLKSKGISGGGQITRFDERSQDTALVYFTDYRDVEAISQRKNLKFETHEFQVEPYFHCFSNDHHRPGLKVNPVDVYYRKYVEGAALKDIYCRIENSRVHQFLLKKKTHIRALQSDLERFANVTVDEYEANLVLSPVLIKDGGSGKESAFETTGRAKAQEFLLNFSHRKCELDEKKLAVVRKMQSHPEVDIQYDDSDEEDLSVRWCNNTVEVVGVLTEVESFITRIKQLVDIEHKDMQIKPAKYKWLTKCKVLNEVARRFKNNVTAKPDDGLCRISFSGRTEQISEIKCTLLSELEKVAQKKMEWDNAKIAFLSRDPGTSEILTEIFQEHDLKAIIDVTSNPPSLWAYESDLQKADKILQDCICTDQTIKLSSEAHHEVTALAAWGNLVSGLQSSSLAITTENSAVVVTGLSSTVKRALPNLRKFLDTNLLCCDIIQSDYIVAFHIEKFHKKKFNYTGLKWYLDHDRRGIALVGQRDIVKKATKRFRQLVKTMEIKDHRISKQNIDDFLMGEKGNLLLSASDKNICTILVENYDWPLKGEMSGYSGSSLFIEESTLNLNVLAITLVRTTIPWDDSEAVTCIDEDESAGQMLPGGITSRSVSGPKTQKFLCVTRPKDESQIKQHTGNILKGADSLKCSSVSMPVFTARSVSREVVATQMLQALCEFDGSRKTTAIKRVNILAQNSVEYSEFKKVLSSMKTGTSSLSRGFTRTETMLLKSGVHRSSDSSSDEEAINPAPMPPPKPVKRIFDPIRKSEADFGSLTVTIQQGNIIVNTSDIIVNSIGSSFVLEKGGAVSKSIEKQGGPDIQKELSTSTDSQMRVTTGGKLQCQKIIHVSVLNNQLEDCLLNILKEAENLKLQSLAIPAIGTGGLGISSGVAAQQMKSALSNFSTNYKPAYLKKVEIVIFEPPMLEVYKSHLFTQKAVSSSHTHAVPARQPRQASPSPSKFPFKVSVRQGSITDDTNDMIVNSLGDKFSLSAAGAVSKEILQKGGPSIQDELTSKSGSEMRVTSAGKLKCKKILHVVTTKDVTKLKSAMMKILEEADKQQMMSLSIPAIGTGGLGLQSDQVAKELFAGVKQFASSSQTQNLTVVDFVIFQQKMIDDFKRQHAQLQSVSTAPVSSAPPTPHSMTQLLSSIFFSRSWKQPNVTSVGKLPFKVCVRQGSITDETNDMIVNSLGDNFTLHNAGAVSKEILQKGGSSIQDELTLKSGSEMRVTSAGKLKCKKILHVVTTKDVTKLKSAMMKILEEADKQQMMSLSIPAIGTGGLGLRSDQVAEELFAGLKQFASSSQTRNLAVVDFVIFQQSMIDDFKRQHAQLQPVSTAPQTPQVATVTPLQASNSSSPATSGYLPSQKWGSLNVSVRQGDITKQKSDMIVNSLGSEFDLTKAGIISKIILRNGGSSIQDELEAAAGTDMRVTGGGSLPCTKILHLATPKDEDQLGKLAFNILETAETEKCSSIAIPAVGTGGLGLTSSIVSKTLMGAIYKFAEDQTPIHLKDVSLVIFDEKMLLDFEKQLLKKPIPGKSKPLKKIMAFSKLVARRLRQEHTEREEKTLTFSSFHISVREGDFTKEKSDVLVNNAAQNFNLSEGNIPQSSYGQQGRDIQSQLLSSSDKVLRITSPGDLKCKKVYHVPFFGYVDKVKSSVVRIFKEMVKAGHKSVSLSPLSVKKYVISILNAAIEFSQTSDRRLMVDLFSSKLSDFDKLHDIIIKEGGKLPGARIQRRTPKNEINLRLCCICNEGSIEGTIKQIEEWVDSSYLKENLQCANYQTVKQRKWENIRQIARSNKVEITHQKEVDTGNDIIVIEGIKDTVLTAKAEVQEILFEIAEAEKVLKLGSYYWQYLAMDNKTWTVFGALENKTLEELFQGKIQQTDVSREMFVDNEKRDFEINIQAMKMVGYREVELSRNEIDEFPKNWRNMGSETFQTIKLKSTESEYLDVEKKFIETLNNPSCTILSIERVQNKRLWGLFEKNKKAVKKTCVNQILTRQLFHGTNCDALEKICRYGFDRIFSAKNMGSKFGCGNYFAVKSWYSARDGYSAADANGERVMFLAEVITGDFCKGDPKMITPPPKGKTNVLYDSLVDDCNNPTMFVVFHDASVYPSYIVRFKL